MRTTSITTTESAPFWLSTASIESIRSVTLMNKVTVTVTATATCGPLENPPLLGGTTEANVNVTITQGAGHAVARAVGSGQILCDGSAHDGTITLTTSGAPFHSGQNAAVVATRSACGIDPDSATFVCVDATTSGPIQLRNTN
jgi:hypothetical protein